MCLACSLYQLPCSCPVHSLLGTSSQVPLQPGTGRDKELQQAPAFHPTPPFAINRSPGCLSEVSSNAFCCCRWIATFGHAPSLTSGFRLHSPLIDHQLRQSSCAFVGLAPKHLDSDRFGEGEGPDASISISCPHLSCPVLSTRYLLCQTRDKQQRA